jgi:hypothetical protein
MRFASPRFARWLFAVVFFTTAACLEVSEESPPTATCVSGKKWVAGDIGHAEMHPGRNCVGCHLEHDGPPLAIGGTVYAANDQETDCYGVENVAVVISDVDGTTHLPVPGSEVILTTNAAGNFFLEGDPNTFDKPYNVTLRGFDEFGMPKELKMATTPETGDCGQCHGGPPLAPGETTSTRKVPFTNISLQHPIPAELLQPLP